MAPAARIVLLRAFLAFAGLIGPPAEAASEAVMRLPPSRPGAEAPGKLPLRKFGHVDYVRLSDVAGELNLKLSWVERRRKAALAGPSARAELETGTRDIIVNGLRVFLGHPVADASGQLYVSRIDFERCLTPLLRPGQGVAARPPVRTIVLDPGHGGRDTGTSVHEKTYALDVSLRAKQLLEAAGFRVILTREKDEFVEHAQRAALANLNRADVFVSVHFNALANDRRTQGVEVYTFPPRSQNSTNAWSAGQKPNAEDTASPNNAFDHWNVVLAQALHRELVNGLKSPDRGKKLMHLRVLRPLQCPGVLVECGFLTSDAESARIGTPAHRQKIAEAIAAGVRHYAAGIATR